MACSKHSRQSIPGFLEEGKHELFALQRPGVVLVQLRELPGRPRPLPPAPDISSLLQDTGFSTLDPQTPTGQGSEATWSGVPEKMPYWLAGRGGAGLAGRLIEMLTCCRGK